MLKGKRIIWTTDEKLWKGTEHFTILCLFIFIVGGIIIQRCQNEWMNGISKKLSQFLNKSNIFYHVTQSNYVVLYLLIHNYYAKISKIIKHKLIVFNWIVVLLIIWFGFCDLATRCCWNDLCVCVCVRVLIWICRERARMN